MPGSSSYEQRGKSRGKLETRAFELLNAAAAGQGVQVHELATELAKEVLAGPEVVFAMRILSGSEHAFAAAIELAKLLVLGAAPTLGGGGAIASNGEVP